ncbi:type II secretion system minor pseudopilin GspI [Paraglaciecola hydrolytica]|uniref:type II secretion system minor pseudopilin GspI n=1 Tax=Paraglaciecola hydrolytica TaxID=1799789 RepID=UPI0009EB9F59|nr:type II secretion system minor pseudopilin GspI [Paraglaciecola hydrolytica]
MRPSLIPLRKLYKQAGLTLLEVMVALLIFAVTGSAILKAAGDHLSSVSIIQDMTFATWVANNRLTELQLSKTWPPKNNEKGSEEMADRTWYWSQRVEKTIDEDLLLVEVTVSNNEQRNGSVTSVTSYLAKRTQ